MLGRWATLRPVTRTAAPLSAVPAFVPLAVVASEDQRFCLHGGVDWGRLRDVVEASEEDGPNRGASTLPMQVAKNLFLWPGRSYLRKGLELPIALYLDLIWSKRRMMEVYLNVAEWGEGVFGIEAAAQRHFGKSAGALTRREAALLVTALPNPIARNPGRPVAGPRRARRPAAAADDGRLGAGRLPSAAGHGESRPAGWLSRATACISRRFTAIDDRAGAPERALRSSDGTNHGCSKTKDLALSARHAALR
jgi:monofunctional biosynthetic peptidoglycan transglycosylase